MRRSLGLRCLVLSAVLTLAVGVAGCGGSDTADDASPAAEVATPTPTPTSTPPPPPPPPPPPAPVPGSLLSGRQGVADGPTIAVKIDNIDKSLPHVGLTSADVVYVQQVEGGLTRLAAVYSTTLPRAVGPIRSARITDLDMLAQYGAIAFSFSGSNRNLADLINASPLKNVSGDIGPSGYWRERGRPGTHDFFGDPARLLARRGDTPVTRDVGFRFGAIPPGGRPATSVTANYPRTSVGFAYDAGTNRYLYSLDGRLDSNPSEGPAGGTTVIIQYSSVAPSEYGDSAGNNTPFTATIGSGPGVVLRDGQAFDITWQRASADAPTQYLHNGTDMFLGAGQVWVVLLDQNLPASIA